MDIFEHDGDILDLSIMGAEKKDWAYQVDIRSLLLQSRRAVDHVYEGNRVMVYLRVLEEFGPDEKWVELLDAFLEVCQDELLISRDDTKFWAVPLACEIRARLLIHMVKHWPSKVLREANIRFVTQLYGAQSASVGTYENRLLQYVWSNSLHRDEA